MVEYSLKVYELLEIKKTGVQYSRHLNWGRRAIEASQKASSWKPALLAAVAE